MDLSSIEPGETIVNVFAGDFRVNCSKRVNHSIFLLAKCIKVYEDWNIKFSSTASESKLNLVIMGKEIVNIDKLKIPKKSLNGVVSILSLDENGELEGLDDFLRSNPHKLKSKFYEGIKKIYKDRLQWLYNIYMKKSIETHWLFLQFASCLFFVFEDVLISKIFQLNFLIKAKSLHPFFGQWIRIQAISSWKQNWMELSKWNLGTSIYSIVY